MSVPGRNNANKMAPSVSECIFRAEHESGFKNFSSRHAFEKIEIATPKNGVFNHFWKIVEPNHDVLQTSLISKIEGWYKPYQMSTEKFFNVVNS